MTLIDILATSGYALFLLLSVGFMLVSVFCGDDE